MGRRPWRLHRLHRFATRNRPVPVRSFRLPAIIPGGSGARQRSSPAGQFQPRVETSRPDPGTNRTAGPGDAAGPPPLPRHASASRRRHPACDQRARSHCGRRVGGPTVNRPMVNRMPSSGHRASHSGGFLRRLSGALASKAAPRPSGPFVPPLSCGVGNSSLRSAASRALPGLCGWRQVRAPSRTSRPHRRHAPPCCAWTLTGWHGSHPALSIGRMGGDRSVLPPATLAADQLPAPGAPLLEPGGGIGLSSVASAIASQSGRH